MDLHQLMPPRFYKVTPGGCWEWLGRINKQGRPASSIFGMPLFRALCWSKRGPPPSGRHRAAHKCHNKLCVNPEHSEWQLPEVNNPRLAVEGEPVGDVSVRLKRRKSSKGGGRIVEGWCAVFNFGGRAYKSGAYTSTGAALQWAANKLKILNAKST
jgi:hypothetical protein